MLVLVPHCLNLQLMHPMVDFLWEACEKMAHSNCFILEIQTSNAAIVMDLDGTKVHLVLLLCSPPISAQQELPGVFSAGLDMHLSDHFGKLIGDARIALVAQASVPQVDVFRSVLSVISFWARARHLIGPHPGRISINALAIMVARVCKEHPSDTPAALVQHFFAAMLHRDQARMVPLQDSSSLEDALSSMQVSSDPHTAISLLVPAAPGNCITDDMGPSMKALWDIEVRRANDICQRIEAQKSKWADLFHARNIFHQYSHLYWITISTYTPSMLLPCLSKVYIECEELLRKCDARPELAGRFEILNEGTVLRLDVTAKEWFKVTRSATLQQAPIFLQPPVTLDRAGFIFCASFSPSYPNLPHIMLERIEDIKKSVDAALPGGLVTLNATSRHTLNYAVLPNYDEIMPPYFAHPNLSAHPKVNIEDYIDVLQAKQRHSTKRSRYDPSDDPQSENSHKKRRVMPGSRFDLSAAADLALPAGIQEKKYIKKAYARLYAKISNPPRQPQDTLAIDGDRPRHAHNLRRSTRNSTENSNQREMSNSSPQANEPQNLRRLTRNSTKNSTQKEKHNSSPQTNEPLASTSRAPPSAISTSCLADLFHFMKTKRDFDIQYNPLPYDYNG
ncbi:Poly(A) polymerase central domain-containing protein [Gongronella butleri]|nr:Poly(A) polymerase central domain-containing protein [Gongronella butleri]